MTEAELHARARDVVESRTRRPAYLSSDEEWAAALAEAEELGPLPPPRAVPVTLL